MKKILLAFIAVVLLNALPGLVRAEYWEGDIIDTGRLTAPTASAFCKLQYDALQVWLDAIPDGNHGSDYSAELYDVHMETESKVLCYVRSVNSSGAGVQWYKTYGYRMSGEDPNAPPSTEPDPEAANACAEQGKYYDNRAASGSECVDSCPNGHLDGACLQTTSPDAPECQTSDKAIVNGEEVCLAKDQCESGETYGTWKYGSVDFTGCFAYQDPPSCSSTGHVVVDEYGVVCETPEAIEDPGPDTDGDGIADANDTDTDGDGIPDANDSDIDGDGIPNESDTDHQGEKIDMQATNQRLDAISNDTDRIADHTKQTRDEQRETNSKLDDLLNGPEGGYQGPDDGTTPTIAQTTQRLQNAITNNPTIAAMTTIPTIAATNACPVWTIPSTVYWDAIPMDQHCNVIANYQGILSAVFMAAWSLVAVIAFLRA